MSVFLEVVGIECFEVDIKEVGYSYMKGIFWIMWVKLVDYDLLVKIIEFNI